MVDQTWSIGELADEFDTTLRTIRFTRTAGCSRLSARAQLEFFMIGTGYAFSSSCVANGSASPSTRLPT
jgi:hypothetical protein